MKRLASLLSAAALMAGFALTGCNNTANTAAPATQTDTTAAAGSIVFFNIDKVVENYDMANDLRSVVETKVSGIQSEIDRRGNKLQKDANDFQNKMDKGLLTSSVANAQYQKLQQQQNDYQQYAVRKQQEMAEEQQVMLNQIMNAISEFVQAYNAEKQYALILTTSGDILPAPVVTGSAALDITDEILAGLNAEYVKTKAAEAK
ncbi:MAG: OmpH family outer membrane protein [Bacteroidales bacterium]|jgi:outer membrane protein|nr:OmpH family outer membrane protein [Bacteroidales bacterium]MBR2226494.1 OmpH family outer membrane protein [Bacteroidales bacterium]MBR2747242.1 OmpH family outer membrane protein [Bacteroidales bacterium]MBR3097525.1 OmpH family outer membrane protein [Bacteroidales bacterium]MBR4686692.1 OmpH family outer membrane protein [Bacteroidales bacterium]